MQAPLSSTYRHTVFYMALLFVIMMISFWPMSFYLFSPKNDALNYFLPVRRLVSESFHQGVLPLWTPYLNLGYPLHGDMQSGVWNPVVQLLSLFGPYHLYTLVIETLIYIYITGVGMFVLLKYFNVHPYANLLASTAIMLCGFNSDCVQFPNWIAGAACLPFLFLFFYRALLEYSWRQGMYTGVVLFMLFTCAYPADFILSAYLLVAMLIWQLVVAGRKKQLTFFIRRMILPLSVMTLFFLALSAPAILSYFYSLPQTQRGMGASFADAMSNPLHPLLVGAYTTPLSTWRMPLVSETDPLERNSSMGLITFIFFCSSFFIHSPSVLIRFCRYAAVIFFIFSLGELGGLRTLSYLFLPLMNTFRHPANAKMFTIFFSCLLAAFTFDLWRKNEISARIVKGGWWAAALLATLVLLWAAAAAVPRPITATSLAGPLNQAIKNRMDTFSFREIVMASSIIQLPFFLLFRVWLRSGKNILRILMLAIANSMLFCVAMQPVTVVKNATASSIENLVRENVVNGYPLPDLSASIAGNSRDGMKYFKEIGVLNLYNKKVGRVDYRITPSNLLSQNMFWNNPGIRDRILGYPLIYQVDSAITGQRNESGKWPPANIKAVLVSRSSLADTINLSPRAASTISVVRFDPNAFTFRISNATAGYYVLTQNYFPRWSLHCDEKPVTIDKVDLTFMGFLVPAGNHIVSFTYTVPGLGTACTISFLTLLLFIGITIFFSWRANGKPQPKTM